MPDCETGENVRLICMGKGYLSPDTKTLADCQIPVFKTHPTPVNVSVKPSEKKPVPKASDAADRHNRKGGSSSAAAGNGHSTSPTNAQSTTGANNVPSSSSSSAVESGCGCMIQ